VKRAVVAAVPHSLDRWRVQWHAVVMSATETAELLASFPTYRFKQALEWMDKVAGVPKEVALAKDAALWLTQADILRQQEEELMEKGEYESALGEHRVILSAMIAEGERILLKSKKAGISQFPSGFTLSDFEAAVESVRLAFRCQHAPENTPAVKDLLDQLLHAP
jgi:hypothetical protein